ncbi:hypothetical protein AZE42_10079 [Rhizopogon vesiculosus]|uniref:Uncharacterized protein n=1 Tax=Rhizopogon vesiculosus TaxID=180088 RepID=A0A1J8Q3B4_9AGAM|nr:hypothetical protein AZE42_10079 [Rhizopogon vesiculosus]
MASTTTQPAPAANEMILTPVITLEGHEKRIQSLSYLQDGRQMVSVCLDKTVRRWDLQANKEIEEARKVCDHGVHAVAESRDGRWAITAGGDVDHGELKVSEVEMEIVKSFEGHSKVITCIDISADDMLLASGSGDHTARLWSLDTGKLVAGPFESAAWVGAIRFSHNSKKLAVNSWSGENLEVWDVQTQSLDRRVVGKLWVGSSPLRITFAPVFWTNKETILAAFNFDDLAATTIYEFDASTLETVGTPFEGHTKVINGVALSFDGGLLASASGDHTIRLWAFESRQLLASFVVRLPH